MDKYGTPWALLCLILAALLVTSYSDKWRAEDELESLQAQVEELEHSLEFADECSYCGTHEYEYVFCEGCDAHFPEEFAFMVSDEPICPLCVNEEFEYALSSKSGKCANCNIFYERKWGANHGLCEDCGLQLLTECEFCWEWDYTVYIPDNYICLRCLGNIVRDMNLGHYLELWRES